MKNQLHGIKTVLRHAWATVLAESQHTSLIHWNESVFRFYFVRSMIAVNPAVRCDVEWRRIDLLVRAESGLSLVEFKFHVPTSLFDLRAKRLRAKGGPGRKNFQEFCQCVTKLATIDEAPWRVKDDSPIVGRYIVLVYADSDKMVGERSYRHWYDPISLPKETCRVATLRTLLSLDSLYVPELDVEMKCKLLQVVAKSPTEPPLIATRIARRPTIAER